MVLLHENQKNSIAPFRVSYNCCKSTWKEFCPLWYHNATSKGLRLPSIAEMIRQESASMVYKAMNGKAPPYLSSLFNSISTVTNRMLRNSNLNLRSPRMKTKFGQNSFAYRGATIWNSLSNDCRTTHTFPAFKVKLKAMLA